MSKISVVFWTQGGNTESMANAIVEGIKEAGKEAEAVFLEGTLPAGRTKGILPEADAVSG